LKINDYKVNINNKKKDLLKLENINKLIIFLE